MYDFVIVGASPSGANLARLIGNRFKVLLIDRRDLEDNQPEIHASKCCGGLLAPDAQKMIAKLGLGVPKDILVNPQLFAVRTIDLTNHLERHYQRFYLNIDREKFDRWLVSMIPVEVDRKFGAVFKTHTENPGGYEISYSYKGQEITVKSRYIIGADGACSKVRNLHLGKLNMPQKYIAIQKWFDCPNTIPYYTAIFDEEISDFYSWIIPKQNYLLLGSALIPGNDIRKKYELLKTKIANLGFQINSTIKTEAAQIIRPSNTSHLFAGSGGIALVGEAAGAISPSSAEGISYALKSSLYLAQSLGPNPEGFMERYSKKMADIRWNLLGKNLKSPAMYQPFLRRLVMKSGIKSIK